MMKNSIRVLIISMTILPMFQTARADWRNKTMGFVSICCLLVSRKLFNSGIKVQQALKDITSDNVGLLRKQEFAYDAASILSLSAGLALAAKAYFLKT